MAIRSVTTLAFLAACGSNAATLDAPGDVRADVAFDCLHSGGEVAVLPADGGQIFVEYMNLDADLQLRYGLPSGVTTTERVISFFLDAQTPNNSPLPMPGQCTNLDATNGWPLHIGTPRVELDAGTLDVIGSNADGMIAISVPRLANGTDALGRAHELYYQSTQPRADTLLRPDSTYTVQLGGASIIQPTTLPQQIFLPAAFEVTTPTLEDNGPLVAGTDYTVHWAPVRSMNLPAGEEVLGLTWLADITGKPTHLCAGAFSAGQFTIPGSAISDFRAIAAARGVTTSQVLLVRQAAVHRLACLPNNEPNNDRRIDMLGLVSWVQQMDVQ